MGLDVNIYDKRVILDENAEYEFEKYKDISNGWRYNPYRVIYQIVKYELEVHSELERQDADNCAACIAIDLTYDWDKYTLSPGAEDIIERMLEFNSFGMHYAYEVENDFYKIVVS